LFFVGVIFYCFELEFDFMRRFLVFSVLLVFFVSFGSADVFYEVESDEDDVEVNTTLRVDCDVEGSNCPVNRWRLNWSLPSDSEVLSIRDSIGEIEDYNVRDKNLSIVSNSGGRRSSETINIQYRVFRDAEEIHKGLYKRNLDLPGFRGEKTSGVVSNPDLVSGWMGRGFDTSYTEDNMSFTGTGSSSLRINFGRGNETEYYSFFGGNPDNTSLAYEVSVGMTGLVQGFDRFPVALMNPSEYNGSVVGWSSGEYVAGSFRMRDNLEDDFLPVLAHETVHGLNERELNWDSTSSTWFDEGAAKYVESMMNFHLNGREKTRKLFGESTTYTEDRNGQRYRVTAPSAGNPDRLWKYYQDNEDFMKDWNPRDFPDERSFGYAYSELIIRNYVSRENGSLRELYNRINPQETVGSNEEKWMLLSEELDLTPCKYESRERFDQCLEDVNQHDYKIYRAENVTPSTQQINLRPIKVRETSEKERFQTGKSLTELENFFNNLQSLWSGLIEWLSNLF